MVIQCIQIPQKIYRIIKRLKTPEEVEQYFPGFISIIDCTEQQQIPRPADSKRKRRILYSGKKKKHTIKTQIMFNNHSLIHKLGYKKGRRHDYDIYRKNHVVTPEEVVNVFDREYLGVEKDFSEQLSSIPNRKKRNLELSQVEIEYNKFIQKRG